MYSCTRVLLDCWIIVDWTKVRACSKIGRRVAGWANEANRTRCIPAGKVARYEPQVALSVFLRLARMRARAWKERVSSQLAESPDKFGRPRWTYRIVINFQRRAGKKRWRN